ncbi:ATP-binding protein [Desulfococcaceae bacterium HSG8]|nr:ATP-binding protein [Desulfococcaceae bacterium HSG8]
MSVQKIYAPVIMSQGAGMKPLSKLLYLNTSITTKLLFLNVMIFIVFGVIILVMVPAFRDIEELTAKIIDRDVNQVIHNARSVREFSDVSERTNLLISTFYQNEDRLKTEGELLLKKINRLSGQSTDENLNNALRNFEIKLRILFEQCSVINDISERILKINADLMTRFERMESMISENMNLLTAEGKDISGLQHADDLLPSYKETLLRANLYFAALETLRANVKKDINPITILLADLHMGLRAFVIPDPETEDCVNRMLEGVSDYKDAIISFYKGVTEFHKRQTELNIAKSGVISSIKKGDEKVINKFDRIREETRGVMKSSIQFVYILSGVVIVLFGAFTYIFFLLNIRRPMESICRGLDFIGDGDMDARIQLGRADEWSVIEQAINRMVGEIWNSYAELYRKNEELQKIHKKLWKSQRYIKNIIDAMPSIVIGMDNKGRITHWNAAAEKAVGIESEEVRNRFVTDVYPEMEDHMEQLRKSLTDLKPYKAEKQIRRKQDETCFEDIMIYPLVADGVEGAVIRIDDVTSRVRIEEMMIQTEKMMSVGGLAAGMAHEINNPLGAILQGVQNTLRRLSPEISANISTARECGTDLETVCNYLEKRRILKYLNGIREAGNRAARIVTNMLNFSRQSETNMSPSDINNLLDNTIELAANDYDLKKKYDFRYVEIIREYDPELPYIPCISTEIEQVILNLVKNSAQAMAEIKEKTEPPRITLRTKKEGKYAQIEVQDNGPGMNEKIRTRVFEPFYTTKRVGVGTGLGLSVSYFIITSNHKGTISVESEPGRGAKFIIRLPPEQKEDTIDNQ